MCLVLSSPLESLPRVFSRMLNEFKSFFQEMPKGLLLLRGVKHQIGFVSNLSLPNRPAYRANPKESKENKKQVMQLLEKGLVRKSKSPCTVLVILVPKKDGSWHMCMGFHSINFITIRYRHSIPCLGDLLDELHGVGYHQINIKEGDKWKTAFKTKLELYEWLVMPFGLTNTSIYSSCMDDHVLHVKSVLLLLKQECLYGVKVDLKKVNAIQIDQHPKQHFVKDFSTLTIPLYVIVKKEVGFKWEDSQERAFQALKEKLTHAPILALLNISQEFFCYKMVIPLLILVKNLKIESIVHSDHEVFKHLRSQTKLNKRHTKLIEFLEQFSYIIKHKQEAYKGSLMGHFGGYKTCKTLLEHFFWPHMKCDVHTVCEKCLVCKYTKSKVQPRGHYTPLPILSMPWVYFNLSRERILFSW
ncbi:hypothetical protein CR513_07638, partial [Mucuna pruriens]